MTPADLDLLRQANANEAAALTDLVAALPEEVASRFGAETRSFGGAVALALPGTGTAFFNRVIGLGSLEEATVAALEQVHELFRASGSTFMVHLEAAEEAAKAEAWLLEHGFVRELDWIILHRDARPLPDGAPSLPIRLVEPDEGALFAETLCAGYGMPDEWAPIFSPLVGRRGWEHLFALGDDGAPIGTGSVFYNGRMAWHGNGSTLPAARRRGAHAALSAVRVRRCLDAGCEASSGETWSETPGRPNSSLHNHLKAGWRELAVRRNYVLRP